MHAAIKIIFNGFSITLICSPYTEILVHYTVIRQVWGINGYASMIYKMMRGNGKLKHLGLDS